MIIAINKEHGITKMVVCQSFTGTNRLTRTFPSAGTGQCGCTTSLGKYEARIAEDPSRPGSAAEIRENAIVFFLR